eukprot:3004686-Amphidinium_carterae.1
MFAHWRPVAILAQGGTHLECGGQTTGLAQRAVLGLGTERHASGLPHELRCCFADEQLRQTWRLGTQAVLSFAAPRSDQEKRCWNLGLPN